jgi:hypothetical protein
VTTPRWALEEIRMTYSFGFIFQTADKTTPSDDFDWIIDFDEGDTPIFPVVGDKVYFGDPPASYTVVDRQIRFGDVVTLVFWVKTNS